MARINLRTLPSLRDYSNGELKVLASAAPAREYPDGYDICEEGQAGRGCYLLAIGSVDILKKTEEGIEQKLATLPEGTIVGQMALVDRSPRSATVRANGKTVALELTRDVFEHLLRARSPLALRFQEQIAVQGVRQLRTATEKLTAILAERERKQQEAGDGDEVDDSHTRTGLLTVQAALSEWDMSLDDLDDMQVSNPAGMMSAQESKQRSGAW